MVSSFLRPGAAGPCSSVASELGRTRALVLHARASPYAEPAPSALEAAALKPDRGLSLGLLIRSPACSPKNHPSSSWKTRLLLQVLGWPGLRWCQAGNPCASHRDREARLWRRKDASDAPRRMRLLVAVSSSSSHAGQPHPLLDRLPYRTNVRRHVGRTTNPGRWVEAPRHTRRDNGPRARLRRQHVRHSSVARRDSEPFFGTNRSVRAFSFAADALTIAVA
jgi:hypothetical protein